MRYSEKLKVSFKQYWNNKSLLSVLLLEFIARTLLLILFLAIDVAILTTINNVQMLPSGIPDIQSFMNMKTYIAGGALLLTQLLALLYVNSFFSAGYFGMLKNVVQDGSTTFDEFLPSAKRYWYATFRFLIIPYIATFLALIPFLYFYGVAGMVAAFGGNLDGSLITYLALTILLALIVIIILLYLFSYGPAIIVFDDVEAGQAMRESITLARRKFGPTSVMVFTSLGIVLAAFLLYHGINLSFAILVQQMQQQWMVTAARILELLLQVLTISASIIASIFVFITYDDITTAKAARHVPTHKPVHHIKRRT